MLLINLFVNFFDKKSLIFKCVLNYEVMSKYIRNN